MATDEAHPTRDIYRYAVDFAVDGDLKYLSHQDTIRLFTRAFARAELPVRFSEGFNPRPRMSLPLPRPVGVASRAERLIVQCLDFVQPDEFAARLADQMPRGITIREARPMQKNDPTQPALVIYDVHLPAFDHASLRSPAERILASDSVRVTRKTGEKSPPKDVDIRPFIRQITVTDDGIRFELLVTPGGTAKPIEVCNALGIDDPAVLNRIRRTEVQWQ